MQTKECVDCKNENADVAMLPEAFKGYKPHTPENVLVLFFLTSTVPSNKGLKTQAS